MECPNEHTINLAWNKSLWIFLFFALIKECIFNKIKDFPNIQFLKTLLSGLNMTLTAAITSYSGVITLSRKDTPFSELQLFAGCAICCLKISSISLTICISNLKFKHYIRYKNWDIIFLKNSVMTFSTWDIRIIEVDPLKNRIWKKKHVPMLETSKELEKKIKENCTAQNSSQAVKN